MEDDEEITIILAARERVAAVRRFEHLIRTGHTRRDAAYMMPCYNFNTLRRWQRIYGEDILSKRFSSRAFKRKRFKFDCNVFRYPPLP